MEISISRIRRAPQHLRRYRDILSVMARYGFGDWIARLPLGFAREFITRRVGREAVEESAEVRIRKALEELGPTFVKLGQLLSVRPDIIGPRLSEELSKLQDMVPPCPWEEIRPVMESELGGDIHESFEHVEERPVASASLAQVHRALLKDGSEAAVKVLRPGVERTVETDMEILQGLAELVERHVPETRPYNPKGLVAEFRKVLLRELDLRRELHNMETFCEIFQDHPILRIPAPFGGLSSRRVLTMEFLRGVKATDLDALSRQGADPRDVAEDGARVFLEMIFDHGVFHGDPHPGNFVVLADGRLGLLDYGMVGRLSEELLHELEEILMGVAHRDARRVVHSLIRMGAAPADTPRSALQGELQELLIYFSETPIGEVDISMVLFEFLEILRRYRVILPPDLALLAKVILTLDGTGRQLHPGFRLMTLVLPYSNRLIMRRLSPARQWRKVQRVAEDMDRLLQMAPGSLSEVIRQLESGRLTVQMRLHELEEARATAAKAVNRLVMGIIISSLWIASAVLVLAKVPPVVEGYSMAGVAGFAAGGLMALRLLWAIYRSGRLR
jgi:ubiquinone biosynthesis protein